MSEIRAERLTAEVEGEFVVFLIGMRVNKLWKVHRWVPVGLAMSRMLRELEADPGAGFLGVEAWPGRTAILVQYWRSFEALERYAMAFVGGAAALPVRVFQIVVGAVLLLSAAWLLGKPRGDAEPTAPPRPLALGAGVGIGLLAGLTGTGGGIFLTPLLLLRRWARAQTAAGVTAPFVLVNSLAGLAGNLSATRDLPSLALPLAGAVALGGFVGSSLGSRRLPHVAIERLLALVLVIAGSKLVLGL